jgi:hypothetical protein
MPPRSLEDQKVSSGELDLQAACLQSKALPEKPRSLIPIILKHTVPDQLYESSRVVFYLDGEQVHDDPDSDKAIDDQLAHRHWFILRVRYRPPLSEHSKKFILGLLEKVLTWRLTLSHEDKKGGRIAQYGPDWTIEKTTGEIEEWFKTQI